MTNEVINAKIEWMKQMATILNKMLKEHTASQEAADCSIDNPLFEDTCNLISLRYEISVLEQTLKNMAKYSEIVRDNELK